MFIRYNLKRILRKKAKNYRFRSGIIKQDKANLLLHDIISQNKPFAIGKLGESELEVLCNFMAINRVAGKSKLFKQIDFLKYGDLHFWSGLNTISKDSGFFPPIESLLGKFSDIYFNSIEQLDIFATMHGEKGWFNNRGEDRVINKINPNVRIISAIALEPYYFNNNPWFLALKNKKILVIHPFADTIKKNLLNKDKLFPFKFFPTLEIITYKPVQSIAYTETKYKSWFEALDKMKNDIKNISFDIALLGCGAYGLPLAVYIKSNGQQAIHIGGALQIFFGIKGQRWLNHPVISSFFNKYWSFPFPHEKPKNSIKVGDGKEAYW